MLTISTVNWLICMNHQNDLIYVIGSAEAIETGVVLKKLNHLALIAIMIG